MDKRTEKLVLDMEELKLAIVELAHIFGPWIPEGSPLNKLIYQWGKKLCSLEDVKKTQDIFSVPHDTRDLFGQAEETEP